MFIYPIAKGNRRYGCVYNRPQAPEEMGSKNEAFGFTKETFFRFGSNGGSCWGLDDVMVVSYDPHFPLYCIQVASDKVQLKGKIDFKIKE